MEERVSCEIIPQSILLVDVRRCTPIHHSGNTNYKFDGLDTIFGYVVGQDNELGYFLLSELESYTSPLGARIERDEQFTPMRLSEVKKLHPGSVSESTEGSLPLTMGSSCAHTGKRAF
jgi:Protein of unknown function (DUF2958)